MNPTVGVDKSGPGAPDLRKVIAKLSKMAVYVGVPESKNQRDDSAPVSAAFRLGNAAGRLATGKRVKRQRRQLGNAELLYIHTHGSKLKNIPARPVIEPAIEVEDNREAIAAELSLATQAAMQGDEKAARLHLKRAGITAQNRVRAWFDDPRNGWAPNAPSTIKAKCSDHPLVDEGDLKKAIISVVKEN